MKEVKVVSQKGHYLSSTVPHSYTSSQKSDYVLGQVNAFGNLAYRNNIEHVARRNDNLRTREIKMSIVMISPQFIQCL